MLLVGCAQDEPQSSEPARLRVALFNIKELSVEKLEAARSSVSSADLRGRSTESGAEDPAGSDRKAEGAAQVHASVALIAAVNPDVLVVQEIDAGSDEDPAAPARLFASILREAGVDYPHVFAAPSNTGRLTGIDLDRDGLVASDADRGRREHGNDSFGFGTYPGQYAMAVLSRLPFDLERTRTFQRFLWQDLPGHHIDTDLDEPFLSDEARSIFRLSSKSHWDLPVRVGTTENAPSVRLLISHPTPPVFDGPEDRNGRRNFDEIKFWADYLSGSLEPRDDNGSSASFAEHSDTQSFVIAGDLNAFPDSETEGNQLYDQRTAISQLLDHPLVQEAGAWLISAGALVHSQRSAGPPEFKERATAGFGNGRRIDYLLPSRDLRIERGAAEWPDPAQHPERAKLVEEASDHRLLWLDLAVPVGVQ